MSGEIPKALRMAKFRLAPDLEIEVAVLEDGRRLITQESFDRMMEWLGVEDETLIAEFRKVSEADYQR